MPEEDFLLWVDVETSGLDPATDELLEVAVAVTDGSLGYRAGISYVIKPSRDVESLRASCHAAVLAMHDDNGLWSDVAALGQPVEAVESLLLDFAQQWVPKGASPMCGNSVHFDRLWLSHHMPRLHDHFHYRNLDVSSWKEGFKRWAAIGEWKTDLLDRPDLAHRAHADVTESIKEMQYYRRYAFRDDLIAEVAQDTSQAGPQSGVCTEIMAWVRDGDFENPTYEPCGEKLPCSSHPTDEELKELMGET